MKFINRKNTQSVKWDATKALFGEEDLLPMWVADMDFQPPEKVLEAMKVRLAHGIFGYTMISESTIDAIIHWIQRRHNWSIDPSWLLFNTGIVPSIGTAIHAFTQRGDQVLLQSPVYTPFFQMIESNGRKIVDSPLQLENGRYEIDFLDFEEKLKSGVKLFLLCSPHNPTGRVWNESELRQMAELCNQYGVVIISDEIHADLVSPPYKHIPLANMDEVYANMTITLMAPSKTFNIAGLQASYMVIPSKELRKRMENVLKGEGFFTLNTFGIIAMEAAYTYGEQWLEEVLQIIRSNVTLVRSEISIHLPFLDVVEPEGTFLVWIDCRKTGLSDLELRKLIIKKGKLAVNFGNEYGTSGKGFIRMNVACSEDVVREGLNRLKIAFSHL